MSGQSYIASHARAFYGGFFAAIATILIIWSVYGFRRALLWPLIWIGCTIAPLLPLIASPFK